MHTSQTPGTSRASNLRMNRETTSRHTSRRSTLAQSRRSTRSTKSTAPSSHDRATRRLGQTGEQSTGTCSASGSRSRRERATCTSSMILPSSSSTGRSAEPGPTVARSTSRGLRQTSRDAAPTASGVRHRQPVRHERMTAHFLSVAQRPELDQLAAGAQPSRSPIGYRHGGDDG